MKTRNLLTFLFVLFISLNFSYRAYSSDTFFGVKDKTWLEFLSKYPSIDFGSDKAKRTLLIYGSPECVWLRSYIEQIQFNYTDVKARVIFFPHSLDVKSVELALDLYLEPTVENYFRLTKSEFATRRNVRSLKEPEKELRMNYARMMHHLFYSAAEMWSNKKKLDTVMSPVIHAYIDEETLIISLGLIDFREIRERVIDYRFKSRAFKEDISNENIFFSDYGLQILKGVMGKKPKPLTIGR